MEQFLTDDYPAFFSIRSMNIFHLVPQYINYVHNLSQLLNNTKINKSR